MQLPLPLSEIWRVFEWAYGRKAENKKAVCEWLEAVYGDLESLSKVWFRICKSLETKRKNEAIDRARNFIVRSEMISRQSGFAGRLMEFNNSASLVLGTKETADFHSDFVNRLGKLLSYRRNLRMIFEKELPIALADPELAKMTLLRMGEEAEAIQREAVSLQVLIRTFKAKG